MSKTSHVLCRHAEDLGLLLNVLAKPAGAFSVKKKEKKEKEAAATRDASKRDSLFSPAKKTAEDPPPVTPSVASSSASDTAAPTHAAAALAKPLDVSAEQNAYHISFSAYYDSFLAHCAESRYSICSLYSHKSAKSAHTDAANASSSSERGGGRGSLAVVTPETETETETETEGSVGIPLSRFTSHNSVRESPGPRTGSAQVGAANSMYSLYQYNSTNNVTLYLTHLSSRGPSRTETGSGCSIYSLFQAQKYK
jgi:hypothetical protein